MLKINATILINETEIKINFVRSPGPGGQNVNKVATAAQLRFDIRHSPSLSEEIRERLLKKLQHRITQQGELIIKASRYRSQERNKQDALQRFQSILHDAIQLPKKRKKTKPTLASIKHRLDEKKYRAKSKLLRRKKIIADE